VDPLPVTGPGPIRYDEVGNPIYASFDDIPAPDPGVGTGVIEDQFADTQAVPPPPCIGQVQKTTQRKFDTHWQTRYRNKLSREASWEVTQTESSETSFELGARAEAEFSAAIFAKIKAEISAKVTWKMSTSRGQKLSGTAAPKSLVTIRHGVWSMAAKWSTPTQQVCRVNRRSGTAWAPYTQEWQITERRI
jgi:hypothetical protein